MNYTHTRQREIIVVVLDNANESEKYEPLGRGLQSTFYRLKHNLNLSIKL